MTASLPLCYRRRLSDVVICDYTVPRTPTSLSDRWFIVTGPRLCNSNLPLHLRDSELTHTPEYISDLLTSVANIPGRSTLRASSCGNLVVPQTRRRIGDRAFSVAAPRAWNRLPTELKPLRSTDLLRRDLKTFLFHSVNGHQDTD